MTSPTQKGEIKCACIRDDARDCVAARYHLSRWDVQDMECACPCHEGNPCDYDDEDSR